MLFSVWHSLLRGCGLVFLARTTCAMTLATTFAPIPQEVRSTHYIVSINGHRSPVVHAASNYYLLNFDVDGPATVSITADDPHFWDRGVEVQPVRHGIRPVRHRGTITFPVTGPVKLSISRPGDHFAESEMLFLFGNVPEAKPVTASTVGVRYFGPGAHHENIDAQSGDRIYLAPGAVIFGALNLWQVHDVRIFGTGIIVYDGPQNPNDDEGWMHKPNWHCIVMDNANNVEIDGITCITRSRTWQVQMKDSRHIGFYNVKVVGGNPNNANQDGLDWLGGGDTTVSNSFFRASDDVFALQGNWDGYDLSLLTQPGHDVTNISISGTVASTSISNTIRVGWPQKTFNTAHFHMSDMDVIHTGFGACKVPFAFFELWADPDGHGSHDDYSFQKIRLEDWYSLFQLRQPAPQIRNVSFDQVWAMNGAAMLPPVVSGDVQGVRLRGAALDGITGTLPMVLSGAEAPKVETGSIPDSFQYSDGVLLPGTSVRFTSYAKEKEGRRFEWIFGDGRRGSGQQVVHRFADGKGTLLDGSGSFRVLLHVSDADGTESWSSRFVVLGKSGADQRPAGTKQFEAVIAADAQRYDGSFDVPVAGGYTVTLLTSTAATLSVDGRSPVLSPKPRPQVCGATGDAVQPVRDSVVLAPGKHSISVIRSAAVENAVVSKSNTFGEPLVLLEGPSMPRRVLHFSRDK